MRVSLYITLLILAVMSAACGHPDSLRLEGKLIDESTINLRVLYDSGRGMQSGITASRNGKFRFEGRAERPTLIDIYDNEYRLLGRTYGANGEDIKLTLDRSNPYNMTAKGNPVAERWAAWLHSHADSLRTADADTRNRMVAGYVGSHRDDIVSALLMMTLYDSSGPRGAAAAALWDSIAEEARPPYLTAGYAAQLEYAREATADMAVPAITYMKRGGHAATLRASDAALTLIVLSAGSDGRDSLRTMLRSAQRHVARGRFALADLSLDRDTVEWRRTVTPDSATWTQGWVAGGISEGAIRRIAPPSLPYFVALDSAGRQLWRGNSATEALSRTIQLLK